MGLKDLIFQVISSWQVIAATVVIIVYFIIVSKAARIYHRPRSPDYRPSKSKKVKAEKMIEPDDDIQIEEQ